MDSTNHINLKNVSQKNEEEKKIFKAYREQFEVKKFDVRI